MSSRRRVSKTDLYTLIINQLMEDGLEDAACVVAHAVQLGVQAPQPIAAERLTTLVENGLRFEQQSTSGGGMSSLTSTTALLNDNNSTVSVFASSSSASATQTADGTSMSFDDDGESDLLADVGAQAGIDFDKPDDTALPRFDYATVFVANHKQACVAARFSSDGRYLCTSSTDNSIKLLDVNIMKSYAENASAASRQKPTLKTFYDHSDVVNDVVFHPSNRLLASCSNDCTIRLFDIAGTSRRAHKLLNDATLVFSIDFHPSGDYLLATTNQSVVRLFDLQQGVCYKTRDESAQHVGPVNSVAWTRDGTQFATCGDDGTVKLWDGVSLKCAKTFAAAHRGAPVISVQFSRSQRYLLTSASDASTTIWDVATQQPLTQIAAASAGGIGSSAPIGGRTSSSTSSRGAVWSFDERLVFVPTPHSFVARILASRTGALLGTLGGHNGPLCTVTSSSIENVLASTSVDSRCRFWMPNGVGTDQVAVH